MEKDNEKKAEEEKRKIMWDESSEAIDNTDVKIAEIVESINDSQYSTDSSHTRVNTSTNNEKTVEEAKKKILRDESSEAIDNADAEITKIIESINDSMYSTDSSHSRVDTTIHEKQAEEATRTILWGESSEAIDNADAEIAKIIESMNDFTCSADSSHSRVDTTNNSVAPEEDAFTQLKTKNTKKSRLARQAPGVSSDYSQDYEPLANHLRKPSDSQYSSDDQVNSPKKRTNLKRKITSDSEENDDPDIPTTSKGRRRKKKQRLPVKPNEDTSTLRESDGSQTEELSDSSDQNQQTFSSVTTESLGSFVRDGSDDSSIAAEPRDSQAEPGDSQSEESNNPGCSDRNKVRQKKCKKVTRKKYRKVQCGADISDEDENEPKGESPMNIVKYQEIMYKYKRLKKIILTGKAQQVHDIIYRNSYDDLVLPVFSELLWAVVTRSVRDMVQKASLLVQARVDVNFEGPDEHSNNTLLHVVVEKAYKEKYEKLAFILMEHGADINRCNGQGNTVLFCAVKSGSIAIVEELMNRNVQLDNQYDRILRLAAENSSCDSARILASMIEYKALDKELKKERATQALRWLVKSGQDLTAMRVLLDYGLPLDQQDNEGHTLLHNAVIDSNDEMVKLLLEYGANPRISRRDGKIPLWHAAGLPKSTIAGLLIKYGASVYDRNDIDGQYPLHKACNFGSSQNIKLLLHFGADINVTDNFFGWTPFGMISDEKNDANIFMIRKFAFLRSKGVKIGYRDSKKISAYQDFRIYYCQCLSELEKMKDTMIFEKVSVYCILDYDIEKISRLIENFELIEKYHEMKDMLSKNFPNYTPVIRERMKIAWLKRDKLGAIENAMKEGTNNALPPELYEQIAYIACCESLIDFDLDVIRDGCN